MSAEEGRPWTVSAFETLSIVLLISELVVSEGFSAGDILWMTFYLWLILSISRKKSRVGRMVFTVLFAVGALLIVTAGFLLTSVDLADVSSFRWFFAIMSSIASAVQLWLIWSPATDKWITRGRFVHLPPTEGVR